MNIKIPTRADTIVSNKGRYYGAGGRTRTGTLSPAVDFESTTSTIPSHRHRCFNSIIHPVKNSKQNFRWPISLQKLLVFPVFHGMIWFSSKI